MQARSLVVELVLLVGAAFLLPNLEAQDQAPAPQDLPPAPQGIEVQARGPVHEAFAPLSAEAVETKAVPKQPPAPLEEMAPEEKPEGEVIWIKGYWAFDEDRNDYLWVSGTWRAPPPGKQWVPGYWHEQDQTGWQWVPGFWTTAAKDPAAAADVSYLSQPPVLPPMPPPGAPPRADAFYVPSQWVWAGDRYVLKPGYWAQRNPDYIWVADHYRWTPSGYIFIPGYWDLAMSKRGFLYAPVFVNPAAVNVSFTYTPVYVVRDTVVLDSLFVRPMAYHYYFGDYYGPAYQDRGFVTCVVYSQRYYDPIIVYETPRQPANWLTIQITLGNNRAAGLAPLPPRTLVQQQTIINQTVINQTTINKTTINQTNINQTNVQMLAPASQVAKEKGIQVTKLDTATRRAAVQQAVAVQQAGTARAHSEAAAGPMKPGMAPRTAKLDTVQTQSVKPGFVPPTPKTNTAAAATTPHTSPMGTQPGTHTGGTPGPGTHTGTTVPPPGTHTGTTTPPGTMTHPGTTPPGTATHPGITSPGTATHPGTIPPGSTTHPGTTPPGTTTHPGTSPPGTTTHPGTTPPGTTSPNSQHTPPPGTTTSPSNGQRTPAPGTTPPGTTPPGTTPPGSTTGSSSTYPPGSSSPMQPYSR